MDPDATVRSFVGAFIFRELKQIGQVDLMIRIAYVLVLGIIGSLMLWESIGALRRARKGALGMGSGRPNGLPRASGRSGERRGRFPRLRFRSACLRESPGRGGNPLGATACRKRAVATTVSGAVRRSSTVRTTARSS